MSAPTLRARVYRAMAAHVLAPVAERVARHFELRAPQTPDAKNLLKLFPSADQATSAPRIWFHASSIGELESLHTLAAQAMDAGYRLVITYFSQSADGPAKKISASLKEKKGTLEFVGYSPWEGHWKSALEKFRPHVFVTVKYESWPELWAGLSELGIPMVILGAKLRKNMKFAANLIKSLGATLPETKLALSDPKDELPLRAVFPDAEIRELGDPRWDRVWERSKKSNPRVQSLIAQFQERKRPWGVLGSVWLDDLRNFGDALMQAPGTTWIVPHDVDAENVSRIASWFEERKRPIFRTSSTSIATTPTTDFPPDALIVVDEKGFLSELYAHADWAYVGGGFSKGVHSTIEPAIAGIPIACAPKNADKFAEIYQLREAGQLTIVHSSEELEAWITALPHLTSPSRKTSYKEQTQARLGATQRIFDWIDNRVTQL